MTKQEEIREGLYMAMLAMAPTEELYGKVDRILSYLHSQGVVIKVDRELPDRTLMGVSYRKMRRILNAGYVAVKPLIGEK